MTQPPVRGHSNTRLTHTLLLAQAALLLVACGMPESGDAARAESDPPSGAQVQVPTAPIIIAHRGASGHRPEHTLEAYELAIEFGADFVEPDLVITSDGVLVARHENEIGGTTDVAERFPDRRTTKLIDGDTVAGWFTEDFTLAELKTLRARERLPFRDRSFDGQFSIPTFDEVLELVAAKSAEKGRSIGVYPETKHPTYFRELGLPLEEPLVAALDRYSRTAPSNPVFIQSFEVGNLRMLRDMTQIPLVQLVAARGAPWDLRQAGDSTTYASMITPAGLATIAGYAYAIGAEKSLVQPTHDGADLPEPTSLVRDAHAANLGVHVWTLRSDSVFLAPAYNQDPLAEWRRFVELGVDGMFGDSPDDGVAALRGR